MEDNTSQMELVLDEEDGVTHHFHQSSSNKPGQRSSRNICFMATAAVFILAFVFLIGYLARPKADRSCDSSGNSDDDGDDDDGTLVVRETFLDWSNITTFLKSSLTTSSIENSLGQFSSDAHEAGSKGDEDLGEKVLRRFEDYGMSPWTDEHFINVQERPANSTNRVTFRGAAFEESGYLVYSPAGRVQGAVLYAHYGRVDDFRKLRELNLNPEGRIILVRAGKNSFAEKVANAVSVNASAVLIYPDPADYALDEETDLFGHVHLGCGDPYTPGFPSFSHTPLPPGTSLGLPTIPAQTIKTSTAAAIMRRMEGPDPPPGWGEGGLAEVKYRLGSDNDTATLEVKNVLTVKKILNVFGIIRGVQDPDHYVVIGAQRDAWGPGFARSTVGTSLLVELARTISDMIKNIGFRPRRSLVFASWSAGEYGAVGATEWLEGYQSSLNLKAFSYVSLDGAVSGSTVKARASPLLYDLIQSSLKEVSLPGDACNRNETTGREAAVLEPLRLSDSAYPFLALSGISSVSFHLTSDAEYPFFGTVLDTRQSLYNQTCLNAVVLMKSAGEVAGLMALRLVHDRLLRLNVETYSGFIRTSTNQINKDVIGLQKSGRLPGTLNMQWFVTASGSYHRAAAKLTTIIQNSDLEDAEQCRLINDRIIRVERDFLSPYMCPLESQFRHVLLGTGSNTLEGLRTHVAAIKEGSASDDIDLLKKQFALVTWTIQSCANALAGGLWDMDEM